MRAYEEIERDYEEVRKRLDTLDKERGPLLLRSRELSKEMEMFKVYHGIFHPMFELEKYKGKDVSSIRLIVKDENSNLTIEDFYSDEDVFFINDQGHLEYSSLINGCMEYDEETRKYVFMKHFNRTEYDFVGFIDISLMDA